MADKGPVILAQRSKERAVLVSIEQWNQLEARLKMLEALYEARLIEVRTNQADAWRPGKQTNAKAQAHARMAD